MIHISNAKLHEVLTGTIDEVAAMAVGSQYEFGKSQLAAAVLALSLLVTRLGLKDKEEGIAALMKRLSETDDAHSIFVEEHRKIVGTIIHEMFAPTGATRFVMIGVTDENKCIVIPVQSPLDKTMQMDEVVSAFQYCIDSYKNGETDTLDI